MDAPHLKGRSLDRDIPKGKTVLLAAVSPRWLTVNVILSWMSCHHPTSSGGKGWRAWTEGIGQGCPCKTLLV